MLIDNIHNKNTLIGHLFLNIKERDHFCRIF
ncbi:hypothetical protein M2451_001373 [Dysgonomonas sp. PFB1-18]|nr:hypothetical protein [Dysgonomonas sp. PF1-14]MDH6380056.1 hypothetical protein [Dysgonomonas sp. PFB1-18]